MAAQLPLFRHPTMTVLIDDDRSSLATLQFQLEPSIAKRTFNKARAAARWIADAFKDLLVTGATLAFSPVNRNLETAIHNVDVELDQIYRYVGDPQRFLLPTVVVIDYLMPDMDGLEFCKSVADLPCKKILFTSLDDDKVAIDAFNKGLIDRFVRKQEPTALDQIEAGIDILQNQWFLEQSRAQVERLDRQTFSFLSDVAVCALIKDLCDRYGYVEYYLLTSPSGFLFFDTNGRSTLMVIQTEMSLHGQADIAADAGVPHALLEDLVKCRVVPFFRSHDGMWHADMKGDPAAFCKPAQICSGDEPYYWALFEPPAHWAKRAPYSHSRFLREHNAVG